MKRCPKCKTEKQTTEFGRDRSRPDGFQRYCKTCCCAYQKSFRADNRVAVLAERADYYRKNRSSVLSRMQRWQQNNPDKVRAIASRRRVRKLNAFEDGSVTPEAVQAVFESFGCRCAYCGSDGPLQEEHVVPVSKGGPHIIENIVPACQSCNASKGDAEVDVWYASTFGRTVPTRIAAAFLSAVIFRRAA